MASEAIIAELLRQEEARRNQPSGFQQGMASAQQVMQGLAQGIQLYDAVKGLGYKYGTPGKTVTTPAAPQSFTTSVTQPTPSMTGSPTPVPSPAQAGASSGGIEGILKNLLGGQQANVPTVQVTAGPQTLPTTTTTPPILGTAAYDLINKAGETFPQMGREAAVRLGATPGLSKTEITANATKQFYLTDEVGTILKQFAVPKGSQVNVQPPGGGNILEVGAGGKVKNLGEKKRGDIVLKEPTNAAAKTPQEKLNDTLKAVEDDARQMATSKSSDFGVFDAKKFDKEFPTEFRKLVNQRLPNLKPQEREQLIMNRFNPAIDDADNFRRLNPELIGKAKARVQETRVKGTFNPVDAVTELKKYGIPDAVIQEIIQGQ